MNMHQCLFLELGSPCYREEMRWIIGSQVFAGFNYLLEELQLFEFFSLYLTLEFKQCIHLFLLLEFVPYKDIKTNIWTNSYALFDNHGRENGEMREKWLFKWSFI